MSRSPMRTILLQTQNMNYPILASIIEIKLALANTHGTRFTRSADPITQLATERTWNFVIRVPVHMKSSFFLKRVPFEAEGRKPIAAIHGQLPEAKGKHKLQLR